jgi:hypothetical protein
VTPGEEDTIQPLVELQALHLSIIQIPRIMNGRHLHLLSHWQFVVVAYDFLMHLTTLPWVLLALVMVWMMRVMIFHLVSCMLAITLNSLGFTALMLSPS